MKASIVKRGVTWGWVISGLVLLTLVGSAIFALVGFLTTPAVASQRPVRSDYLLRFGQCVLGIIVLFLPFLIQRRLRVAIPGRLYVVYLLFLYAALYLGEVQRFYERVPGWDKILHGLSGLALGALGFSLVSLLNSAARAQIRLSPFFVAVFAFSFALALGVVWEIYEFSMDSFFGFNMQRARGLDGAPLVGEAALRDTMTDLLLDTGGALVMSVIGYVSLRRGSTWLEKIALRRVGEAVATRRGRRPGPRRRRGRV